jgi:hypothetical protein
MGDLRVPEFEMYKGEERLYVPFTMQITDPGTDLLWAPSREVGLLADLPEASQVPLGET